MFGVSEEINNGKIKKKKKDRIKGPFLHGSGSAWWVMDCCGDKVNVTASIDSHTVDF